MPNPESSMMAGQIQIEIDDATAQGEYVNLALISHSETEMILDFIFIQPQAAKAKVRSRLITSPLHAKKLLLALEDNVKKYESRFGKIELTHPKADEPKVGFYH